MAQPLSALIESGRVDAPETRDLLWSVLRPHRSANCLVLACTHYIAVEAGIRTLLPGIPLVDPAAEAWRLVRAEIPESPCGTGTSRFYTTGDAAWMRAQGMTVFGVEMSAECTSIS